MAGKKQKRYSHDGYLLPDNLYQDEPGVFRYIRPDGTKKIIRSEDTELVIKRATEANRIGEVQRKATIEHRDSIIRHVEMYIPYRESLAPKLKQKESWKSYQSYLRQFAKIFSNTPVNRLDLITIQKWWDQLTPHAQRSRRAEFNKFFNFLMMKEAVPRLKGNPFSTSDDRPRVLLKPLGDKVTHRMNINEFWEIYAAAADCGYEFVQIGMAISFLTTLRRGDILRLTFQDNIIDNHLRVKVSKSHEKAVKGQGSNISLDLSVHTELNKVINRARELSLKNRRCPHLISHSFDKYHKLSGNRIHANQVLPRYFTDAFVYARDLAGVQKDLPKTHRCGFHEIRSLSSYYLKKSGHDIESIQMLMAHTDPSMTKHYQDGHETDWHESEITIKDEIIGGSF